MGTSPPVARVPGRSDSPHGRVLEYLFEERPDGTVTVVSITRRRWLAGRDDLVTKEMP